MKNQQIYGLPAANVPQSALDAMAAAHASLPARTEGDSAALTQDDIKAMPQDQLEQNMDEHRRLIETIRADAKAERRAPTARETRRLEELQESLAVYQAEDDRRRTPNKRKVPPEMPRQFGGSMLFEEDRGNRLKSAARTGVLLQASMQSAFDSIFAGHRSGHGDWKDSEEFLRAVANRVSDPRLIGNATGVEGVGVDGGFDVPPAFYRGVIDQAMQSAEFAGRCRIFPSDSNTLTIGIPDKQNRSNGIAGLRAYWSAENDSQTPQSLKWRAVELKLNKTFILAESSLELLEDGVGYTAQLTTAMGEASAYALDSGILYGTGAGQPLGLLNHASALQIAAESGQAADTVLFENLVNLWARLAPACQKRAAWFCSPNLIPQLLFMKFPGSDNPVMLSGGVNDAATGAPGQTIFGRPVVVTEIAPQLGSPGDIVLADLSQYALLMKSSARLETNAGPGFARDVMSWRMIQRVSGQPLWDEPITPFNGGPTLSWATYLAERS